MRPRYSSTWFDDDWAGPPMSMDVFCANDDPPQKTGLVDAEGRDIYRISQREPIGFRPGRPRVRIKANSRKVEL